MHNFFALLAWAPCYVHLDDVDAPFTLILSKILFRMPRVSNLPVSGRKIKLRRNLQKLSIVTLFEYFNVFLLVNQFRPTSKPMN